MRRALVAVVLAAAAFLTACGDDGVDAATLRVGTLSDSKPNAYQEDGEFTGFDNELLRAIAEKQGLRLEFTATEFSTLLGKVANGQYDIGSSAIAQTEERKRTVDFSAAYNYQSISIATREDVPVTDERSLSGRRVAVVQGTVSDSWLTETAPDARAVRFPDDAAALAALRSASVDAAVFDRASAEQYAADDANLVVAKSVNTDIPHGFAVRKGDAEVLEKLNAGLREVIADGTWERLHEEFEPIAPVAPEFTGGA